MVKHQTRILIVDDNVSLGQTMALILKYKGYIVDIAISGLECIEYVEMNPYDIVFMDIKMPFMNGVEALRRKKVIRPDIVVMMMTAYAIEELIQKALQEGAYGLIYKPLDIERVLDTVEEVTEHKSGGLILIVDDDETAGNLLKETFKRQFFEVGIAHSTEEALVMAQLKVYDIIFIDMKLPILNGLESYLKIHEANAQIVTIIITAYPQKMDELLKEAMQKDAYPCIYKPLDMEELFGFIEEIMDRKRRSVNSKVLEDNEIV